MKSNEKLAPEQEVQAILGIARLTLRAVRKIRLELSEKRDVEVARRRAQHAEEYLGARLDEVETRWGPYPRQGIPKVALQLELDAGDLREAIRVAERGIADEECAPVALRDFRQATDDEYQRVSDAIQDAQAWLATHVATVGSPRSAEHAA